MPCNATQLADTPHQCVITNYTANMTEMQFGLLLAIGIALPLYVKFEDPIPVAVGLTLVGGLALPALPGQAQHIAWVILFLGLVVGVFTATYKGMIR
jgi:hypothetical protein